MQLEEEPGIKLFCRGRHSVLLTEEGRLLRRRDCPLAEKEKIMPSDLAGMPLIIIKRQSVRNLLENWFGDEAGKIRVASTCNLSQNKESLMVERGMGLALVIEYTCDHESLCLKPLEPEIASGCVLVWKKNQTLSPAMARFI